MTECTEKKHSTAVEALPDCSVFRYPLLCLVLAFAVAGGTVLGESVPLGVAFVAAAGPGLGGFLSLVGTCLGYGYFFGLSQGIEYITAALMLYTIAFVCQYTKLLHKPWFMPGVTALVLGVTMAYGAVSSIRSDLPYVLRILFEVVTGSLCTAVFSVLTLNPLRDGKKSLAALSRAALFAALVLTLSRIRWEGLSLGRILVQIAVLCAAYAKGPAVSCCVGTGFGFAADLSLSTSPVYHLIYGISGLAAGIFRGRLRLWQGLTYGAGICLMCAVLWRTLPEAYLWQEALIAALTFLLLPKSWLRLGLSHEVPEGEGEKLLRARLIAGLQNRADAISALSALLQNEDRAGEEETLTNVYERASDAVCMSCQQRNVCWSNHYLDMMMVLQEAAPKVAARGCLCGEDLPEYFKEYCRKHEELILAVNYELRRSYAAGKYLSQQDQYSAVIARQLEILGQLEDEAAALLKSRYQSAEAPEIVVMRYFAAQGLSCCCGAYTDAGDRLHLLLRTDQPKDLQTCDEALDTLSQLLHLRLCSSGITSNSQTVLELSEAEPYAVTVGVAVRKKRGELVCGDHVRHFKTREGKLYVLLSDGMGTGEQASVVSERVLGTLERLLKSRIAPLEALELLNNTVYLRGTEDWTYATADVLEIDLFTGTCRLFKYGAAPTRLYDGQQLREIPAQTVSLGMMACPQYLPDVTDLQLQPGTILLMASDGVVFGEEETLLQQLSGAKSMKLLARELLMYSDEQTDLSDDQTVVTLAFSRRK